MIINIPLTIDNELWASALARDYESKVTEKLTNEVRKVIKDHDSRYYMRDKSFTEGLNEWVDFIHRPKMTKEGVPYTEIYYPIPPVSLYYEEDNPFM